MQIKKLNDEFDAYKAEWLGAKVRFVKMAKKFTSNVDDLTHIEVPSAEASAQPIIFFTSKAEGRI